MESNSAEVRWRKRLFRPRGVREPARMTWTNLQLMRRQVEALFTHDADGRIRFVNEPGERPAPRFFLGRTSEGNLWRYRYDLPDTCVAAIEALLQAEPVATDVRVEPICLPAIYNVLAAHQPITGTFAGPAYVLPDLLQPPASVVIVGAENRHLLEPFLDADEEPIQFIEDRKPCAVLVEDDIPVSICFSSRMTEHAAEAGLETKAAFRRRGYAVSVVAGWAAGVRDMGRIPLYSTSWDNLASQAVARKLSSRLYGSDLSIG